MCKGALPVAAFAVQHMNGVTVANSHDLYRMVNFGRIQIDSRSEDQSVGFEKHHMVRLPGAYRSCRAFLRSKNRVIRFAKVLIAS